MHLHEVEAVQAEATLSSAQTKNSTQKLCESSTKDSAHAELLSYAATQLQVLTSFYHCVLFKRTFWPATLS